MNLGIDPTYANLDCSLSPVNQPIELVEEKISYHKWQVGGNYSQKTFKTNISHFPPNSYIERRFQALAISYLLRDLRLLRSKDR